MNTPVQAPPQQPLIERPSLLGKLKTSLQHRITLVVAPPGYGKTTLVSQFTTEIAIPVAWHLLEKYDQDVPNLFAHCLDSLAVISPTIKTLSPIGGTTPGELAILVTDYLRDQIKTDIVYVMDDIHHLLDAPGAKTWLKSFIATLPPNCHLILVGHAFPPLPLKELIARREVLTIGQEQLGFSVQEINTLAKKVGAHLTQEHVQQIYSRMLGWPAGTLLALQPLPIEIETVLFDGKKGPEALFEDLAEYMFSTQSPSLQDFLLRSSTLSRMIPTVCDAVLHLSNSLQYLIEATDRNLFITRTSSGLVYHSLFRKFLQQRLEKQNRALYLQQHRDVAQWLESQNELDEAFEHYVTAGQWEGASNIAERAAHIYIGQGKPETLLRWEQALSDSKLKMPRFRHFCAMIHRDRYEYEEALSNADAAEAGFRFQEDTKGVAQISLLRATIANQRGHFEQAVQQAEPFTKPNPSVPNNLRGYALAIVGTALLHLHRLDAALESLQLAEPLWRETKDLYAVAQFLITLEVAYLRSGCFLDAAQCLQEILSIRRAFGESVGIAAALNNLAYHYHLLGDYEQAATTLQEASHIVNRIPENRIAGALALSKGDLQRNRGSFQEAHQLYQQALHLIGSHEPFIQVNILISLSTLCRWEAKLKEARDYALAAQSLSEQHHLNWEHQLSRLAEWAVDVRQGGLKQRQADLEAVLDQWKAYPSPQMAQAIGIYALGALHAQDEITAHRLLKFAITQSKYSANQQPLITEIVHNSLLRAFLLQHAQRYEPLGSAIKALEKAQLVVSSESPIDMQTHEKTYSVRVAVFGQETIERDGVPVPSSAWQAVSARKLFYYLLFKGPVSKEDIVLAFWPEDSDQQIRGKFHETLRRARKAIGSDVILFEDERYFINPSINVWCDVTAFQDLVRQAQVNSPLLSHTEDLWHRAVELYQGEFLSTLDEAWIVPHREMLFQMYMDSLLALGDCMRARGSPQEAVSILKRAFTVDLYREDISRALFMCYHQLGEQGLITEHIQELTERLASELGISPSQETIELARKLLR